MYKVEFTNKASKDFFKLSRNVQIRITKAIDTKLVVNPKSCLIPLVGDKAGFYKFRVGDYRLLCVRNDNKFIILVVAVKHRKNVYK